MTTVTFVFLTLFSWRVSSGTWLSADLTRYGTDGDANVPSLGASCISAAVRGKTNLTRTCESCANMLQVSKETLKQNEHVGKRTALQSSACSLPKASKIAVGRSSASASRHCCIRARVLANSWETTGTCEIAVQPVCLCKVPKSLLVSERQATLVASGDSKKAPVTCCSQMLSKIDVTYCQKYIFLTQADGIKRTARADGAESLWVTLASRWVRTFVLAAVLLLGIYLTRMKTSPNRVGAARGSNAAIVILFTVTFHSFSPSPAARPEWSHIAFAICLSWALGRAAAHVLLACRFCPTQPKFRALPVTALLFWLTFRPSLPNKSSKDCCEDALTESSVGSSHKSWAAIRQLELLATLYCMFVSLPCLLQSIVTKLNFLSVFLHVHLVTCLQNTRVPIKYVLVIRINRVI